MKISPTKVVAALALLTLGTLLGSWFRTGWHSTRAESDAIRQGPEITAREELNRMASRVSSRLGDLLRKEDARPYYHYKNLFHDPRGVSQGLSVNRSPLVDSTGDPLITAHFQIGSDRILTIPPINEEVARLSEATSLSANQDRLLALRAAQSELLSAPLMVMPGPGPTSTPVVAMQQAEPTQRRRRVASSKEGNGSVAKAQQQAVPVPQPEAVQPAARQQTMQQQAVPQQQVFEQQAFDQNAVANTVFRELENQAAKPSSRVKATPSTAGQTRENRISGARAVASTTTETSAPSLVLPRPTRKTRPRRERRPNQLPDPADKTPVKVSTHPFAWRTAEIGGENSLVAMRQIDTPTGKLTQGFVIGEAELTSWLGHRGGSPSAGLLMHRAPSAAKQANTSYVAVPPLQGWVLSTDYSDMQRTADQRAAGLGAAFLWKFLPVSFASLGMLVMLVVLVSRAENLANERSQFAAAAAHELRTPLAGLQLYGDMLADGLGDTDAKEKYARHIADEAQRLGRVVSNVLDFSQMEQKGLQLRPQQGNLSETVRRVVGRMKHAMDLAGMELELDLPERAIANYDDDAVYRILQNLIDNAEKYSRDHKDRTLQLTVVEEETLVRVNVSDGGPGVLSQMRQQIFKPFRRAGGADSPAGLGLGLALARSLAQQQGGNLVAEDSALGGARFVLEVPKT